MWQGWEEMAHGTRALGTHVCLQSEFTRLSYLLGPHHSLVKGNVPPMVAAVPGPQVSGINLTLSLE